MISESQHNLVLIRDVTHFVGHLADERMIKKYGTLNVQVLLA